MTNLRASERSQVSLVPWVVLATGLALTLLFGKFIQRATQARERAQFEARSQQTSSSIKARFQAYVALLQGTASYVRNDRDLTQSQFDSFVVPLLNVQEDNGLRGIGWAQKFTASTESKLSTRRRQENLPGFKLHSETNKERIGPFPVQFPVYYIQPLDPRNRAAVGFDMYTNRVRHEAMERALRDDRPSATGKVLLKQEITSRKLPGFLIYLPVYRGATPESFKERLTQVLGFVYCPLRATDLLSAVRNQSKSTADFAVHDVTDGAANLIFESMPNLRDVGQDFLFTQRIDVYGRTWAITYRSDEPLNGQSSPILPFLYMTGVATTLVLFLMTLSETRARRRAQEEVASRKEAQRELEVSENRFRSLVEQSPLSVQVFSPDGRTLSVNRGFRELWGAGLEDLKNYNVTNDPQLQKLGIQSYIRRGFAGESLAIPVVQYDTPATLGTGKKAWVAGFIYPLKNLDGSIREVVIIHQDVSEVKEAEEKILRINEKLESAVQNRTAELRATISELESFSYTVAHDLRSPLRAMSGYSKILLDEHYSALDDEGRRHLGRIHENSLRMGALIDGLLDLARISRMEIVRQPVHLSEMAASTIEEIERRSPREHVVVKIEPKMTAEGDERLISIVLQNLLENAWKFTSKVEDAEIEFGTSILDGQRVFYVRDNGAGFDSAYDNKLFRAFERLHSAVEFPGTGIGLATVRRIVERHGGKIWADGRVGGGATFYFTLPTGVAASGSAGQARIEA